MNRLPAWVEIVFLALIITLAAYLRLHNLTDNPGWYADEATHVNIAHNLMQGEMRYLAVDDSFLVFGRLPLFELLLAGSNQLFGVGIDTARGLTGLLGVLTILLLVATTRIITKDPVFALCAGLALAVYPDAVLYSRIAYSYALLAPLLVLAVLGLSQYLSGGRRIWLALAALAVGLGIISDIAMGTVIVVALLVILMRRWHDALWALPLCLLPFAVYALLMLLAAPEPFRDDLAFTLSRLNAMPLDAQLETLVQNYTVNLTSGFWFPLGVAGLFFLRPAHFGRVAALSLIVPFVISGRTVALFQLSFYYMIPFLPLIALGVAGIVYYGSALVWKLPETDESPGLMSIAARQIGAFVLLLVVVGIPFFDGLGRTLESTQHGYVTEIDPFLVEGEAARQAAAYVNENADPDDVVIASPAVAWLLTVNASDPQMSVAYNGVETVHLPGEMPLSRFAFDPRFDVAHYVIVDGIWRSWTIYHVPGVGDWWAAMQADWPVVFSSGDVAVYANLAWVGAR